MQRPSFFSTESIGNFASGFVAGFACSSAQHVFEAINDDFEQHRQVVNLMEGITLFCTTLDEFRQLLREEDVAERGEVAHSMLATTMGFMAGFYTGQLESISNAISRSIHRPR